MIDSSRKYVGDSTTTARNPTAGVAESSSLSAFFSSGQSRQMCPLFHIHSRSSCRSLVLLLPRDRGLCPCMVLCPPPLCTGSREGSKLFL